MSIPHRSACTGLLVPNCPAGQVPDNRTGTRLDQECHTNADNNYRHLCTPTVECILTGSVTQNMQICTKRPRADAYAVVFVFCACGKRARAHSLSNQATQSHKIGGAPPSHLGLWRYCVRPTRCLSSATLEPCALGVVAKPPKLKVVRT